MKNILPFLALFFPVLIVAQKPAFAFQKIPPTHPNPENGLCNYAGTIEVAQFIGQSTDFDLDTIYLCLGDSILIKHLGDADLSGDPLPGTVPGIGYAFYDCPPTSFGPTLQDVAGVDLCLLAGSPTGLFVTQGVPNGGGTWFVNNGALQTTFNNGEPVSLFFAPITMDDFASNSYESAQVGAAPGPCVNVNLAEAFNVIFLNGIEVHGVSNNSNDDCIGQFTVEGGYAQFEATETYDIEIFLTSDPSVKALIMTSPTQSFDLATVQFSVSAPGGYTVLIEDGKSCGYQFQMDMSGCDATDNLVLDFPEVSGTPAEVVCMPLSVENMEIFSGLFSVSWDADYLKFIEFANIHPAISNFWEADSNQVLLTSSGLSILLSDAENSSIIVIPDGEAPFEICFEILNTLQGCTPVGISNTPFGIAFENPFGQPLAVTALPGEVCAPISSTKSGESQSAKILPNPLQSGSPCYLSIWENESATAQLLVSNMQGVLLQTQNVNLSTGENQLSLPTDALSTGVYFVILQKDSGAMVLGKVLVFE